MHFSTVLVSSITPATTLYFIGFEFCAIVAGWRHARPMSPLMPPPLMACVQTWRRPRPPYWTSSWPPRPRSPPLTTPPRPRGPPLPHHAPPLPSLMPPPPPSAIPPQATARANAGLVDLITPPRPPPPYHPPPHTPHPTQACVQTRRRPRPPWWTCWAHGTAPWQPHSMATSQSCAGRG